MAKLIYSAITSLDGYVADEDGKFDWAAPDEEVHAFVNDLERPIGTYLYGRRMYEVMVYWETAHTCADQPPVVRDFARDLAGGRQDRLLDGRWRRCPAPGRGSSETFDPDAIRQLKAAAERTSPSAVPSSPPRRSRPGWSTSATCSSRPIVVGGGKPALPTTSASQLELLGGAPFRQRRGLPPLPRRHLRRPRLGSGRARAPLPAVAPASRGSGPR